MPNLRWNALVEQRHDFNGSPQRMNFDESVRYLYSLGNEILALKLGLRTTELLLQSLANPHKDFQSVQIAGTNGKGSTAVVLESICRAAQIPTGLFTSPHLVKITERIRVDGVEISSDEFGKLATVVRNAAEKLVADGILQALPTFFEHVTAIALLAFKAHHVKLAILETGLGGRLDSTTVAGATTVGLTPIALDHQEYLGEMLTQIAAEKAAIIRRGVAAVIAPQAPPALEVILKRCEMEGVIPQLVTDEVEPVGFTDDGRALLTFKTAQDIYSNVTLGLRGRHQITNTLLAVQLAEGLRGRGFEIDQAAIIHGISTAEHAGRLELIPGNPGVLLDGAHNPAGAAAIAAYLDEFAAKPITIVFGAMRDKNLEEMAGILFDRANTLILTQPANARAADIEVLREIATCVRRSPNIFSEPARAIELARRKTSPAGLICVTGSLYLIGELRPLLVLS